jgi:hypothetical protein
VGTPQLVQANEEPITPEYDPVVVNFHHIPHQVIQVVEPEYLLLAKMTRSNTSNAPIYFVPPNVIYTQHPQNECTIITGHWEDDGTFVLA